MCKNCKTHPVITLISGVKFCKSCFVKYFERKVYKTIGKYHLIDKKDKIGIAVSGGKDSFALLYILNKLSKEKLHFNLIVIAVDEGIKNYRDLSFLEKFCRENEIKLKIINYKKELGFTLDELVKKINKTKTKSRLTQLNICSICTVFKRSLMNKLSRDLKLDKMATGHNLDDEAQNLLMNQFKGNLAMSARLGPAPGVIRHEKFIPRIKPLYFMMDKETKLYSQIKKFEIDFKHCPYRSGSYRDEISKIINKIEKNHPGTKYAIVNSFLEILPLLKEKYKDEIVKSCKKCKEPCSSDICKVCEMKSLINNK